MAKHINCERTNYERKQLQKITITKKNIYQLHKIPMATDTDGEITNGKKYQWQKIPMVKITITNINNCRKTSKISVAKVVNDKKRSMAKKVMA